MKHVIKKQFIELTLNKQLDHFRLQQLVSEHYWDVIVPMLEKEFDRISRDDEIIYIDKLEIDLGTISDKAVEKNEWSINLASKLEEILLKATAPYQKSATITSKPLSIFRQWLFYMKRGYLPWNTKAIDSDWYRLVLETLATDFESALLLQNEIRLDFQVLKRIVVQHDDDFLLKLSEVFTAAKQERLVTSIEELVVLIMYLQKRGQMIETRSARQIKKDLWIHVIMMASRQIKSTSKYTLDRQLVSLVAHQQNIPANIPKRLMAKLDTILPLLKAEIESEKLVDKEDRLLEIEKQVARLEKKSAIDDEGIFISNAGMVLLHPFLTRLFERIDLLDENKFKDDRAHQTALYVLHYLATRETKAQEHELVIAKILTGFPLGEPVEEEIEMGKEILNGCDEMLLAVIAQWEMLKNTSPDGLREGFLQRPGKLFSRQENIYIQVEKNAIDILLDYLPWNLGLIRLPWLKDLLRVEWR